MKIPATTLLPEPVIRALYLTLAHSLWQGLILAALAAGIILTTRKASPAKRYNLLVGALVLFAAGGLFTFFKMLNSSAHVVTPLAAGFGFETLPASGQSTPKALGILLLTYLNRNAGNIVFLWFLVICFRSLKLLLGLGGLYRLRYTALSRPGIVWQHRIKELAARVGINQAVDLAVSGIAKVPMVIGHLKPLILVPAGLMTLLPPAEVEAILIHELAHIRRRDYLVNILQSIVEIVYFFNPAVWWIAALIRTEREHCCDEIAILQTSSKKNYIQALVSCREYQSTPEYALALTGHRDHLINRVKRILSNSNPSLNRYEKIVLTLCLTAAVALSATVFHSAPHNRSIAHLQRRAAQATTFPPAHTLAGKVNSSAPTIATAAEPVLPAGQEPAADAELAVDAKAYAALPPVVDPADMIPVIIDEKKEVKPVNNRVRVTPAVRQRPVQQPAVTARPRPVQQVTVRPVPSARPVNIELQQQDAQQAWLLRIKKPDAGKVKACVAQPLEQDKTGSLQLQIGAEGRLGATAKAEPAPKKQAKTRSASATDEIIAGLEREGIIRRSAAKLTFVLSNETFVVNGATQPVKVFLKYRDQFIANTGTRGQWEVVYRRMDQSEQTVF